MKLARQVEGVVDVRDKTALVRDVRRQIAPALERLRARVSDVVGYLPLLVLGLVAFLAFWFLASLLERWDGLYRRFTPNHLLADLLRRLAGLAVLILGLVVTFELLGATTLVSTVLGAAGIVGLVLGFALRETMENYLAGVLLSTRQPFARHDEVDIDGHEGQVLRLTSRATLLMAPDGRHVRIPNARVFKAIIVNYTRNPERRLHFDVAVSTDTNLAAAQHLAARTLAGMEGVLSDPPARVDVRALGHFDVTLRVFGWVDQRRFDFLKVRSEAIRLVKEAFDVAGIVMPAPVYDLRMQERTGPRPAETAGPQVPIDIKHRAEIRSEIDADRRVSGQPDLLRPDAPLE